MSLTAINIDADTLAMLDASARFRSLSREDMLRQAIHDAAEYDRYYRENVEAGIKEADEGKLIPNEAVEREMEALIQSFERRQAKDVS